MLRYNDNTKTLDDLISNSEYVFFDIFDTLITRPFLSPKDLFFFIENLLMIWDKFNTAHQGFISPGLSPKKKPENQKKKPQSMKSIKTSIQFTKNFKK